MSDLCGRLCGRSLVDRYETKPMDTDELTAMAYQMIQIAEGISEYLSCDIGVRSREYDSEDDYLAEISAFLQRIVHNPERYLQSWNLDEINPEHFKLAVLRLADHVSKTLAIPIKERGPTGFE